MFGNRFSSKSGDSDPTILKEWAPGANYRAIQKIVLNLPINVLIYSAAPRSVWCRGAGFFNFRRNAQEGRQQ